MRGIPTTPESKWNRVEAVRLMRHLLPSRRSLPSLPDGCYAVAPPQQNSNWQNSRPVPAGRVRSAPLLLYPGIPRNANAAFMASYEGLLVVSYDSKVVGINASTGQLRWTSPINSPITAPLGFDSTRGNV